MMPNMPNYKWDAGQIRDIEEQDDLIRVMAAYIGDQIPADIRNEIRDRAIYFFGFDPFRG